MDIVLKRRTERSGLATTASRQLGLVTRAQVVRRLGTDATLRREVASGAWVRMHRGVYRIAAAPQTWKQAVLAAVLAAGGRAVASSSTAAALWELEAFAPGPLEVTAPRGRRPRLAGVRVHETLDPLSADTARIGPIPVTTVERTLVDLAGRVPGQRLEAALDDALRRGLVSLPALLDRLEQPRHGVSGVGTLRRMAHTRSGVPLAGSTLERRLLDLLRRASLPDPERQAPILAGDVVAYADVAYRDARLVIEVDGYRFHSGRTAWERDSARQNALVLQGWTVLRYSADDIAHRPGAVAGEVRACLARAGGSNSRRPS